LRLHSENREGPGGRGFVSSARACQARSLRVRSTLMPLALGMECREVIGRVASMPPSSTAQPDGASSISSAVHDSGLGVSVVRPSGEQPGPSVIGARRVHFASRRPGTGRCFTLRAMNPRPTPLELSRIERASHERDPLQAEKTRLRSQMASQPFCFRSGSRVRAPTPEWGRNSA
jgi:hypothetical protein